MTTTIKLDFDSLPDNAAAVLLSSIEGFVAGRHPSANFHGGCVVQAEDIEPPLFTGPVGVVPDPQKLSPGDVKLGDGVTWSYASDSYAGTITRFSKTQKSIWFTMDNETRIDDNGPYSEDQKYEYTSTPVLPVEMGGTNEHMARWDHKRKRYMIKSRYPLSPGRRAFRSPHV